MAVTKKSWLAESGQTFRVKGRPHPTEPQPFLIEDISAQVTQIPAASRPNWNRPSHAGHPWMTPSGVFLHPSGFGQRFRQWPTRALEVEPGPLPLPGHHHPIDAISGWKRPVRRPICRGADTGALGKTGGSPEFGACLLYLVDGTELTCLDLTGSLTGATLIPVSPAENKHPAEIENSDACEVATRRPDPRFRLAATTPSQ